MLRIFLFSFIMQFILCLSHGQVWASKLDIEYKIKSAYLLNFILYTEWPQGTFTTEQSPLNICFGSADPFRTVMVEAVSIQKKITRPLMVFEVDSQESIQEKCHVLFIGKSFSYQRQSLLKTLSVKPILTIGEDFAFIENGGMIEFTKDETIHFQVNLNAAQNAGLKFSSRMLSLAEKIIGDPTKDKE